MVLLGLRYGLGKHESPGLLHYNKSLCCALIHFDDLADTSPTGTIACLLEYA